MRILDHWSQFLALLLSWLMCTDMSAGSDHFNVVTPIHMPKFRPRPACKQFAKAVFSGNQASLQGTTCDPTLAFSQIQMSQFPWSWIPGRVPQQVVSPIPQQKRLHCDRFIQLSGFWLMVWSVSGGVLRFAGLARRASHDFLQISGQTRVTRASIVIYRTWQHATTSNT